MYGGKRCTAAEFLLLNNRIVRKFYNKRILRGYDSVRAVKSSYISLSDNVRYRKEYFGGILFNTRTGTMMDVQTIGIRP